MATIFRQPSKARSYRIPFASPHGLIYALPVSLAMWALLLWAVGVIH